MATASEIKITEAYIGLLGRAPDPLGLDYWVGEYDKKVAAGGNADVILKKIMNDFTLSDEWDAGLGANVTKTTVGGVTTLSYDKTQADTVVKGIYGNLFERPAPSDAEVKYWSDQLQDGTVTASEMAVLIILGAGDAGTDHDVLGYKTEAATYYVETIATSDYSDGQAKTAVDAVQGPVTLLASKVATDAIASGDGKDYTLTTAADIIIMTGGDDTITGTVGSGATYNSEDANDASTSDNDTLTLSGDTEFDFNSVTNVENINVSLTDDALTAIQIDADGVVGGNLSLTVAKTVEVLGVEVAGQTAVELDKFGADSLSTTNATSVTVTNAKAMAQSFTLDSAAATVAIGAIEANDTTITLANNDVALTLTGTTATNDSVTIAADNEVALNHAAAATAIENVSLSGTNGALEVTVAGFADDATKTALQKYTVTGDNDVTLIGAGTQFDSSTLTNSGTGDVGLEITAADTGSLEGFGVLGGGIELSTAAGTHSYKLASGNTVKVSLDTTQLTFDANDTAKTSALTLDLDNDVTNGITTANFETVTINGAATNALSMGALSLAGAAASVTSANDVQFSTLDAYSSITLTGDSVTATGNIGGTTEGNDITIVSTNETVLTGSVDTVDTGNFGDVKITAGTSVKMDGAVTVEDLTVIADSVDINNTVTGANDVTITATNDIDYADKAITATTGNIDLTAAAFTGSGTITASAGNITIDGTNDADATGTLGSLVATKGDIQLESGDLNFAGNAITATAGTVKIVGDAEVSTTADLTAGVGVLISSTNDVTLGAVDSPVLSGGSASGSITATFDAGASTTVTANTGSSNDTLTLDNAATTFTVDTGADNDTINVTVVNTGSTIAGNDGIDTFDIAATAVELATYSGGDGNDVFEVASQAVLATIVGGDGTDSLTLETNGVSYKDVLGFTGIEKLVVTGDTTTLDAVDLAGNDSTFEIAGGDLTVTNAGNAAVTLSLAGVTAKADNGVTEEVNYTGGSAADIITGSATMTNNLNGGNGTNSLTGGALADSLQGGTGVDTLKGGLGNDILNGGTGSDQFTIDAGTDVIGDLATGDIVDVAAGAGVTATLLGNFTATADTQNLGSAAADFAITANSGGTIDMTLMTVSNTTTDGVSLIGVGGTETLKGSAGADIIDGAGGADILTGNGGSDTFTVGAGDGDDVITDLSTGDIVTVANGTTVTANGVTAFVATAGTNNVGSAAADMTINSADAGSTVNMTLAQAGNGYKLVGGDGADILTGSTGADIIDGGASADTLSGGDGIDTIDGGTGTDIINGGDGADIIDGGADADVITGGAGNDIITGSAGSDTFTIDAGTDNITDLATGDVFTVAAGAAMTTSTEVTAFVATSASQNLGSAAADVNIKAKAAGSTIDVSAMTVAAAATGGVTITGAGGSDILTGSSGDDILIAAGGTDVVVGGSGNDVIDLGTETVADIASLVGISAAADADTIHEVETTKDEIALTNTAGVGAGTDAGALVAVAGLGGLTIDDVIADTTANLGANAVSVGDQSATFTNGGYAYNTTTGQLFFDADGDFSSGVVLVATLYSTAIGGADTAAVMVAGDFQFGVA